MPSPDWQKKFEKWLFLEYKPKTAKNMLNYAIKYSDCLLKGNLTDLRLMSDDKRIHTMKGLSALSKFLGIHETWLRMVKNYGLKWSGRSNDDLIIERLTKTTNPNEVFKWIKTVKKTCAELSTFLDFMVATGLRFCEAVESHNLIIKLGKQGKPNKYYDANKEILEHFKFREIFLRRTKKVFISFTPSEIVDKIKRDKPLTEDSIHGKLKRRHIRLRFSDVRELHATLLCSYLKEMEINFLHGRCSTSVFMRNYFNPSWIGDLKARTFKAIKDILEKTS